MKAWTINKIFDKIKQDDPNTSITKHAIRQAILNGDVASGRAGARYLADPDDVVLQNVILSLLPARVCILTEHLS